MMMRRAYGLEPAAEITDGIFVGSIIDGTDVAFLKNNNIGLVINCTKEDEDVPRGIAYLRVPVDDDLTVAQDRVMYRHLPRVVEAVLGAAPTRVLVHCFAGRQRSAAVAVACLMAGKGMSYERAVGHVRNKKPDALRPNVNFERALRDYETNSRKFCRIFNKIL